MIASFAALAILNFTTFLAAILMASPVAGLRPIRALRSTRTSRPMPGRTNTPFFLTSLMAVSDRAASKPCETFFVTSHFGPAGRLLGLQLIPDEDVERVHPARDRIDLPEGFGHLR